jgi:hypothetical protein
MSPLPVAALKTTIRRHDPAFNDLNPIAADRRCNDTGGRRTSYVRSEKRPEEAVRAILIWRANASPH